MFFSFSCIRGGLDDGPDDGLGDGLDDGLDIHTDGPKQPNNLPTILAASSFVGLGVITSSPYVSDNEAW